MKEQVVICLQCPFACNITVTIADDGHITDFKNNRCERGKNYATQEIVCPVRVLTSTVLLETKDKEHPMLPVQTSAPIPKANLFDAMKIIMGIKAKAPVKYNEVIYPNILGIGVDLVSTSEVLE
ncbi:MAG: DUF1667 domain-containing protein [Synergistes sp.]|nr:DUF1667 domain-containing protein [Synergistes sp.]